MPVTLLVEPDPGGHRFQAAAFVAQFAARTDRVVLLTSRGARDTEEFRDYLSDAPLEVCEEFDAIYPSTREIVSVIAARCAAEGESCTVAVMDADQSLKRWWYLAPRALRACPRKPRVIFFLTRYPAKLGLTDGFGWKLRLAKGTLALAGKLTGSIQHVAGYAGRDDGTRGWLVKRVRDPAVCGAHARDRAEIRRELGLPSERALVGVFGVISERKNARLIFAAMRSANIDADLLLAGTVEAEVTAWVESLPPEERIRVIVRHGFLPSDLLDKLVAAVDVAPIILTNNGPSGIMGKAQAAGVPVVSAGSRVRARELRAAGGGELAELTEESIGAALRRVLSRPTEVPGNGLSPATAEEFAAGLLDAGNARSHHPHRLGRERPRSTVE